MPQLPVSVLTPQPVAEKILPNVVNYDRPIFSLNYAKKVQKMKTIDYRDRVSKSIAVKQMREVFAK